MNLSSTIQSQECLLNDSVRTGSLSNRKDANPLTASILTKCREKNKILFRVLLSAVSFVALQAGNIALAGGTHVYETELSGGGLVNFDNTQLQAGRKIVDIEMRWDGSQVRYSGVWGEVPGAAVHGIVGVGGNAWQDFVDDMDLLDGRWLDVEVGYFGNQKLWSGIFVEDGDNYAVELRTTMSEATFESKLDSNLWAGRQVVDFEAYIENDTTTYAAVWTNDPNQPRTSLYYHLTFAQVDDLINPQFPVQPGIGLSPLGDTPGRVIDFERYWSTNHDEYRYAIIVSNHESNGQYVRANELSSLDTDNGNSTGNNRRLVDLDVYSANGEMYYLGVWSSDVKALNEVAAIPSDPDPEPINAELQSWIDTYEAAYPNAQIGFYAKNVRTNQSIAYNANRPFYMASTSKLPMHIRLWQMDEDGEIDLDVDTMAYSNSANTGNPWYCGEKALGQADFGDTFTLEELDDFMIDNSDNATTSMLLEMQIGRSQMNEWMASLDGIGRGFHPITAITDLDRLIMWQGQVNMFPSAESYWSIPSWRWEEQFRSGTDNLGFLQDYVGQGNPIPSFNRTEGRQRYFRMGLNSVEPRAFALLQERLAQNQFLGSQAATDDCINAQGGGSQMRDVLDGDTVILGYTPPPFGEAPNVQSKNGGKGNDGDGTRVINDTGFFMKGPDTIVVALFSQKNTITSGTFRGTFSPPIGFQLYSSLISDLKDRGVGFYQTSDTTIHIGQPWWLQADVINDRGGDALPYKVKFYASQNALIDPNSDVFLGEFGVNQTHFAGGAGTVGLNFANFPAIPTGAYYFGWVIDADDDNGEWDETNNTALFRNSDGSLVQFQVYGQVPGLHPPIIDPEGSRYLKITAATTNTEPTAVQVTSPTERCMVKYVDFATDPDLAAKGIGRLVDIPVFRSAPEWTTLHVSDAGIIPGTTYEVTTLSGTAGDQSEAVSATTGKFGDIDGDGSVTVLDLVHVVEGFRGIFVDYSLPELDLHDCVPNGTINVLDMLTVVEAFRGLSYEQAMGCSSICGGTAAAFIPSDLNQDGGSQNVMVELVPSTQQIVPGDVVEVDVYVDQVSDLRAFQVLVNSIAQENGSLELIDVEIDFNREDFVFTGDVLDGTNLQDGKAGAVKMQGSEAATSSSYLATFRFQASENARGIFSIALDEGDQSIFVGDDQVEMTVQSSGPVEVTVGTLAKQTLRSAGSR